jgi:hypothetical protein|tara:strand:+ start:44945 stop:45205 length:261 start_codon:yes stop_codon:yes gene_type:complete
MKMADYKLVYFRGCPNYLPAEELLRSAGVKFESVCQDDLSNSDPLKNYSSPTLLINNKIVFGSEAVGGGCSMPLPSKEELLKILET